jgi:predicted GIY-YIG superfamily endonuclease
MSADAWPHVLYRCYDAADRLLYIGCTHDVVSRLAVHKASWGNPVSAALNLRMTRHTVSDEYPDKATARKAEREAIYAEAPLFNLHHQRVRVTFAERRRRIDEYLEATQPAPDPVMAARLAEVVALFAIPRKESA